MYAQLKRLIQRDQDCRGQDSQVLFYHAQTSINDYNILTKIVDNLYTSPETVDYIVEKVCDNYKSHGTLKLNSQQEFDKFKDEIFLLMHIAKRKDLSFKSSCKLVSLNVPMVTTELAKYTPYVAIQRTILVTNATNQYIVGNILNRTTNTAIIDKYIKMLSEADKRDKRLVNYFSRCIQENPALEVRQMIDLIESGNASPEFILYHPNLNEEVFETLLLKLTFVDLTTEIAVAIVSTSLIGYYEHVLKLIILSQNVCLEKVVLAILQNEHISDRVIDEIVANNRYLVANNLNLFKATLTRCDDEALIESLIYTAEDDSLKGSIIGMIFNSLSSTRMKELYSVICAKTNPKDYFTVSEYIQYMPTQYWENLYNRSSIKCSIEMLKDSRCPKEILIDAVKSRNAEYLMLVVNNPKCDLEVACQVYHVVKYSKKLGDQDRRCIFKSIYSMFGDELLEHVWNINTSDRELYTIFKLAPTHVKCKIAEIIAGSYIYLVMDYARMNHDVEVRSALEKNLNLKGVDSE